MITNVLSANYIINNKMDLSVNLRYHMDQVKNLEFKALGDDGYLYDSDYIGEHNINYTTWTSDMAFNWWFAPGSQMSLVWKNAIEDQTNYLRNHWVDNVEESFNLAQQNSLSKLKVLKGVDLHIKKGEFVSIVGASGAGKTTLLHLLGTLDKLSVGDLVINSKQINKLDDWALSKFRNKEIGFVFQFHNLLVEFTALENVCLPAFIAGKSKKEAEQKATEILTMLGMQERLSHKPNELSGGEQQRVAVARALINSPAIILADEPSGNLDSKNAKDLHQLLLKLNQETGQTIVIVTHNIELANMADRKLEIVDGKLIS